MRFSIVIPVYNVAPYLRECLESVCQQAVNDFECLCVDDGSSDGSGKILDDNAADDPRFRVIHQENIGVSAARNAALDRVEGEWVVFLDADDVLAPCALSHISAAIQKSPFADVIAFKTRRFKDGEAPTLSDGADLTVFGNLIDSRREFDAKNALCDFWGKAYRRRVIGNVRFKPYVVGEDQLFMLEVMLASSWTQEITSVLYGYRQRATSAVHTNVTKRKIADMIAYNFDELAVVERAEKHVAASFVRITINWLTERVAGYFFSHQNVGEKDALWTMWRTCLSSTSAYSKLPTFQRIRLRLFGAVPVRMAAWLLFFIPYWLKTKGFHR